MKTQVISSPLIVSENLISSKMGMDAAGADLATYYMRDRIYTNKIAAVVREYACNALDEHVRFAIEAPVQMKITSEKLIVRDFAQGLSEYDVRNVFGMYFRSTKSNDNNQVGGFGIGAKVGHCYTDTFYVRSFHNGVCSLYACALGGGGGGVPVGHIMKVSEESTLETGIEISVPIKSSDSDTFIRESKEFVNYCKSGSIELQNPVDTDIIKPYEVVREIPFGDNGKISLRKIRNAETEHSNKYYVTSMGNVVYSTDSLLGVSKDHWTDAFRVANLPNHRIVVELPVGSMTLPISREGFETTESNAGLLVVVRKTLESLIREDLDEVKESTDLKDLMKTLDQTRISGSLFSALKGKVFSDIYPVINNISRTNPLRDELPLQLDENGKIIVSMLPNKKSYNYWKDLFSAVCVSHHKQFMYIREDYYLDQISADGAATLAEHFTFIHFKKKVFGWPKPVKGGNGKNLGIFHRRFKVSECNSRWEQRTPLEIHNIAMRHLGMSGVENAVAAQAQCTLIKTTMGLDAIKRITFIMRDADCYMDAPPHTYRVSSPMMVDALTQIGWLRRGQIEHIEATALLMKAQKEKETFAEKLQLRALSFLHGKVLEKLRIRFRKNPKRMDQFINMAIEIINEDTLRGKILVTRSSFSRADARRIMTTLK